MIFNNTNVIEDLLNSSNLKALDSLLLPKVRTFNRSQSFRSALMLSADNIKHLNKIPELNAECIILNLEDGVSSEQKPFALRAAALTLSLLPQCDKKLVVRVNALDEGGREEIKFLNAFQPDAIRVPKIRTVEDVKEALELLNEPIELHLSIETKEAWLTMGELSIEPRVTAYYLGILDLLADMGLSQTLIHPDNPMMHYMLSHFLITSKAAGVKPISFVFQDYRDTQIFNRWLQLEKGLGFNAKGCLSPTQVQAVHSVFAIDEAMISKAREIVRLFEIMRNSGISRFSHDDYGFIDEPIYKGALAILRL